MKWSEILDGVEIDVSSFCNAKCPSCRRTWHGDEMPLTHFDINVWKRFWQEDLKDFKLRKLVLNGNWGDSLMHKDILEMIEYPAKHNPNIKLFIDTNGGMRNPEFWAEFAEKLTSIYVNPIVRFGIDGTDNFTNDIYRVKVEYDRVIENTRAFINAGGLAQWRMTVFDHNVHQVHKAHDIAERMGFLNFRSRKSYSRKIYDPNDNVTSTTFCYDSMDHAKIFINSKFKPTSQAKFTKGAMYREPTFVEHACIWYRERRVQIDPFMNVWPCCHISGELLDTETIDIKKDSWSKYGFQHNNLKKHSFREILDSDYFTKEIEDAVDDARWSPCRKVCGVQK